MYCYLKYNRNKNIYVMYNNHSEKCISLNKIIYDNSKDINIEVENSKKYREIIISKLRENPLMTYTNFKKLASPLYRNNDYNFELKLNTIKNIYYCWRNNAFVFKKYSIFENNKTLNNKIFLRDYCNTYIYETSGNKIYNHEHAIFISPFQLHKLINSPHLYFDGTFVYPAEFSQLLVVLYLDKEINKKAPGAYILLNNKREQSYYKVLKNFKHIITLENSTEISMISYTSDFEQGLANSLEAIFPNVRRLGCFYHYSRNIRKNIKERVNIEEYIDDKDINLTEKNNRKYRKFY